MTWMWWHYGADNDIANAEMEANNMLKFKNSDGKVVAVLCDEADAPEFIHEINGQKWSLVLQDNGTWSGLGGETQIDGIESRSQLVETINAFAEKKNV